MRNRRGEIATILTLGALVIIGVTAVISSFTVKDKKTTNSRASATVLCDKYLCSEINSSYTKGYWYMKDTSSLEYTSNTCKTVLSGGSTSYCKAQNIITASPIPVVTGVYTHCSGGSPYEYYVCGSSKYEDDKCKTKIGNLTNWCKYGDNTAPTSTPKPQAPIPTTATNTPIPTAGSSGGLQYGCNNKGGIPYKTDAMCSSYCESTVGSDYIKNSQGTWLASDGGDGSHYCCCGAVAPLGPDGKPDDACSLIKCKDGAQTVVEYSPSLSQYGIPLANCSETAAYGGILVLTSRVGNYSCSGNTAVETPLVGDEPIPPADPLVESTPIPGLDGAICEGPTTYTCDDKKTPYSFYKSTKSGCRNYCYGTSPDSCGNTYNSVKDSQCKGNVVVPTKDPMGNITPGVTIDPTPLPNRPGMTSITCSKYCSDNGGGTTTKNEQIYLSTSGGGSYQDQNGANLGSAYVEISFHCGCVTPSSTPTQREINNEVNTRTFIFSNSCKYSITGWLENEYGNRITVGSGSTGSISSVQPPSALVKARYHRTNTMMINEHEYTMNGPTYTYDISGNGCNQYQQDEAR